jgi:ketosteroid isomerase-like protein
MRRLVLAAVASLLIPASTDAQTLTPEEEEVWQRVKACWVAGQQNDQPAVLDCFHEDYTFWWSEDIMPFGKDLVRAVVPVNLPAQDVVVDDVRLAKILVKGNVAIVHWGVRRFTRAPTGTEIPFVERVSMTLLKENGRWQYLGGGGSPFVR